MSVIKSPEDAYYGSLPKDLNDSACFFCDKPMSLPIIHWMGATADIFMHPNCAVDLVIRIIRDVHQVECNLGAYITFNIIDRNRRP